MKTTFGGLMALGLSTLTLLADFSEPFTDSAPDRSVTGRGWLIVDVDGRYSVMVRTDTGLRLLSSQINSNLNLNPYLGRYASITATIRQRQNVRLLEITGIKSDAAVGSVPPGNALDAAQVLAIARAAVATNDTWIDRSEFGTPKQQTNGTWSVMMWRLPKQPGGHRFITVDANGKVTDYIRGR
jgi:hypothetical protein